MNHPDFDRIPDDALIRLCTLRAWGLVPFSRSTLWRKCRSGDFPAPVKVSKNVTAWRAGAVRTWLAAPINYKPKVSTGHTRKTVDREEAA